MPAILKTDGNKFELPDVFTADTAARATSPSYEQRALLSPLYYISYGVHTMEVGGDVARFRCVFHSRAAKRSRVHLHWILS